MKYINSHYKTILAFLVGFTVALTIGYILNPALAQKIFTPQIDNDNKVVHVHSDFRFYINDDRVRLTAAKYQTDSKHTLNPYMHIHDGDDEVLHRHAAGITLAIFLKSLGFILTNDCLTTDAGAKYCNNGDQQVMLVVNNKRVNDLVSYITKERDKILLYYGDINNPKIKDYIKNISDKACIDSGTCPEKGVAPPENCGLTCEYVPKK